MLETILDAVFAQTSRLVEEQATPQFHYYFVSVHFYSGARFYSETIDSFEDAARLFDDYTFLAEFVGGGATVELLYITETDYHVISVARV